MTNPIKNIFHFIFNKEKLPCDCNQYCLFSVIWWTGKRSRKCRDLDLSEKERFEIIKNTIGLERDLK